jgi:hypothetical protein
LGETADRLFPAAARRAVAYPLAGVDDDRLPGQNLVNRDTSLHLQFALQNYRVLVNPLSAPTRARPDGLVIFAMLILVISEFTRPMNSSMIFGGSPAPE